MSCQPNSHAIRVALCVQKAMSMEKNGDEPETIDVWELMKDLDEDENLPNAKQPSAASLSKTATTSPSESFTLEPADVREVPRWLSSCQVHNLLGRSVASPAEGSSRDVPAYAKARSKCGSMGGSTSHTSDLLGAKLTVSTHETLAEHLQRTLSFETSPKQEMKRIFGQKDVMDAYRSKGLKLGFDTDSSGFSPNPLPWEGESVSSPSTPSFSGPISLKKWFQDDARRMKQKQDQRAASGQEIQSKLPPHQVSPSLMHVSKVPGPIRKGSEGPYNMRRYVESDVNAAAHRTLESHHVGGHEMSSVGLNQVPQQGHVRRLRHSFTGGNRNKELLDVKMAMAPANNRSSSLELEKGGATPKVIAVLYSTSLKTDTHSFEDSNAARVILTSLVGAAFEEKNISRYPEYEQELKRALNAETALVPTLCVKGRYLTGLDTIMQMYKKGLLRSLLAESLAQEPKPNVPCICRGGKFLICPVCKGKRKLARKDEDDDALCRHCSATGLIKCPNCLNS